MSQNLTNKAGVGFSSDLDRPKEREMNITSHSASNVVSIAKYRNAPVLPALAQIEAYWRALRGGRPIPRRSDIDPRGIETALEYAFILERIAPGIARFRIAGQHMCDVMGMEVRGMPFGSLFAAQSRGEMAGLLEEVFATPALVELQLNAKRQLMAAPMSARMLIMPLMGEDGQVTRALGALCAQDTKTGRAPRRLTPVFEGMRRETFAIAGQQNPRFESDPVQSTRHFAEPRAKFLPKIAKGPDALRPALRLVQGHAGADTSELV